MYRNAPLTELTKKICLGKASRLRRLPQRGFLRHEQTDGEVKGCGARRQARFERRWQCQFHGSTVLDLPNHCKEQGGTAKVLCFPRSNESGQAGVMPASGNRRKETACRQSRSSMA